MYQRIFNELMTEFTKKDIYIPECKTTPYEKEQKYFIYNDNQSQGDIIEKLCQT